MEFVEKIVLERMEEEDEGFAHIDDVEDDHPPEEYRHRFATLQAENLRLQQTVQALTEALRLFYVAQKKGSCREEAKEDDENFSDE